MHDRHQRLIELLDFSQRAPTTRRNEQLKTYLKSHPLPALLDVRAHPMRWNRGTGDRPMKVTPIFWAVFTVFQRHRRRYHVRKERSEVLHKTIDILLRAGDKIDAPSDIIIHDRWSGSFNGIVKMNALSYVIGTHNNIHLAEVLLKRGANPNKAVWSNESVLHRAVGRRGDIDLARLLLKHGANVNIRGNDGVTPFMEAAYRNDLEMVKFLLRAGASTRLADKYGDTPLHFLFMGSQRGRMMNSISFGGLPGPSYRERFFKTVRLLMDHGANPRRKNKEGKTPLNLAEEFDLSANRLRIFAILKEKNRATARHALNKHLPNNVIQQILHRAELTNVNELQGKRRNQETRRNRRLVKRRRT